jgi:hypothetical protein
MLCPFLPMSVMAFAIRTDLAVVAMRYLHL